MGGMILVVAIVAVAFFYAGFIIGNAKRRERRKRQQNDDGLVAIRGMVTQAHENVVKNMQKSLDALMKTGDE